MIVQPPSFDEMSKRVVWISRTGRWRIQWRKLIFIWCVGLRVLMLSSTFSPRGISQILCQNAIRSWATMKRSYLFLLWALSNGLLLHTLLHPLLDNFFIKWFQSPHPTFGMFWKAKNKILPYHWPQLKNFHMHISDGRMTCLKGKKCKSRRKQS